MTGPFLVFRSHALSFLIRLATVFFTSQYLHGKLVKTAFQLQAAIMFISPFPSHSLTSTFALRDKASPSDYFITLSITEINTMFTIII